MLPLYEKTGRLKIPAIKYEVNSCFLICIRRHTIKGKPFPFFLFIALGFRMYILDILEGRRKMLVFGHHRVVLDSVCKLLNEKVKL